MKNVAGPFSTILLALFSWLIVACAGGGHVGTGKPAEATAPLVYVTAVGAPGFREAAEAGSRDALEHATLSFRPEDAALAAVQIDLNLEYRNLGGTEFEGIWQAATFFLLTMYPSTCIHRIYDLRATVKGAGGATRHYQQTDSTVAWVWLLQAPNCGETPTREEVESQTQRMLGAIYRDMRDDDALDAVVRGIVGPEAPLVRIDANRAIAIVEQVALVERPFERWTISKYDDSPTTYYLYLHFDVQQGVFSGGRALLGIMTGGLSLLGGICSTSRVTLSAEIAGPDAAHTRSYTFADSIATHERSGGNDCETIDEQTRPDVFAKVVRKLFTQIRKDQLVPSPALH